MTSAAPSRKPYRKAPPQHREARHSLAAAPVPTSPPQTQAPDDSQVKRQTFNRPLLPLGPLSVGHQRRRGVPAAPPSPSDDDDDEPDVSGLSGVEFGIDVPRPPREPLGVRRVERRDQRRAAVAPKGILKKGGSPAAPRAFEVIGKSGPVELSDAAPSLEREPSAPCRSSVQLLQEKVRFSRFLDEITCRVISPAHLRLLGREASRRSPAPRHPRKRTPDGECADRRRRWDAWAAALRRSRATEGAGLVDQALRVNGGGKRDKRRLTKRDVVSHVKVGFGVCLSVRRQHPVARAPISSGRRTSQRVLRRASAKTFLRTEPWGAHVALGGSLVAAAAAATFFLSKDDACYKGPKKKHRGLQCLFALVKSLLILRADCAPPPTPPITRHEGKKTK